jgi:hypothetical protein
MSWRDYIDIVTAVGALGTWIVVGLHAWSVHQRNKQIDLHEKQAKDD